MDKYFWTEHAKFKMKFYGLSPQRVLRVIRNPQRIEEGIVEKTIAVMQPASVSHKRTSAGKPSAPTWSSEIWAMYQPRVLGAISKSQTPISNKVIRHKDNNYILQANQLKIISAWRYPGVSPKKDPIPEDIIRELADMQ